MPKAAAARKQKRRKLANREDVRSIFGDLDETKLVPIMELRPALADLEAASMWLGGDADVFEARAPVKGIASQIVTILTADEEEEPPRTG